MWNIADARARGAAAKKNTRMEASLAKLNFIFILPSLANVDVPIRAILDVFYCNSN